MANISTVEVLSKRTEQGRGRWIPADRTATHFAAVAAVLIFLSLLIASPWSLFRSRVLKNIDTESDLIPLANPDIDSCGRPNPFWAKIRKEFYKSADKNLTYPGNEAPPGLALLRNPTLGLYNTPPDTPPQPLEKLPEASPARFIYLVQGPGGLPSSMASACGPNSTLIMLSYMEDREDTLFVPKSSWTKGRNILFAAALRLELYQGWRFSYYIFLDDDAELAAGSWQDYEQQFLVHYVPAMATPYMHTYILPAKGNFTDVKQPSAEEHEAAWAASHKHPAQGTVTSVYFFDAMVTAYHREAAVQLLPYSTTWDTDSWWISHFVQCHRAALLYHGHVLMYDGVRITNPEHRPYRRRLRQLRNAEDTVLKGASAFNNSAIGTCWKRWLPTCPVGTQFGEVEGKVKAYDEIDYSNATPCQGESYDNYTRKCRKGEHER